MVRETVSRSNVNHAGGIQAGEQEKSNSLADYLAALKTLEASKLSFAELSGRYDILSAEFNELVPRLALNESEVLDAVTAQLNVLKAIVRAKDNEQELPPPSDSALAQKVAGALNRASEERYAWLNPGMQVVTTKLGTTSWMMAAQKHLDARRAGESGSIVKRVPGNDLWFVKHADRRIAIYSIDEMRPAKGHRPPERDY
jgi:hypothetical protein